MIVHAHILPAKHEKCILFFNGWGMDCNAVKHLQSSDYDIFICYDYRNFTKQELEFNTYKEVSVIAWSLGVWVAEQLLVSHFPKFTKTIAINGTPQPIDNNLGIAEQVFAHTLENWNEHNRKKFNARMCGGNKQLLEYMPYMSQRSCEEQREELQFLYNAIRNNAHKDKTQWTEAIIGTNDLIFTAQNQHNYWQNHTNCRTLPLPHFPFAKFRSWDEILYAV
jgi:biotin synthesis protein BioG